MRKINKFLYGSIIAIIIAMSLTFIKLPYIITSPGSAEPVRDMVSVQNGDMTEKGSLLLTTVSMMRANPLNYIIAQFRDYDKIYPIQHVLGNYKDEKEYSDRQVKLMDHSQEAAKVVAYEKANKKVEYFYKGVIVLDVIKEMPAYKILKSGDKIISADNRKIKASDEFINLVKKKRSGDIVRIVYIRDKKERLANIKVKPFPEDKKRVGIGISLATDQEIKVYPPVKIEAGEIGGPSAGLMFSLEIYNQLTKGDLTKGYHIAGTGTVDLEGNIGPIGGISQKVVAAHNEGAQIFFAPNENGKKGSNYREAVKAAKDIKTEMKIVPVDTFEDAINYLKKLKG
jgi:PDZ domain-containing protein